jgi:hypothetical protein
MMANVVNITVNAMRTPNTGCLNNESPNLKKKFCDTGFSGVRVFGVSVSIRIIPVSL